MATYGWSESAKRYRDLETGRFVPRETVLSYVEASIEATSSATASLAEYVAGDVLSPGDWRLLMRREIKDEYVRQYVLGKGGVAQMTQADWGSIGGMLKEQYGYLDDFARQVAQGTLSEAQIRARAQMYIRSAREAYERAHSRVADAAGMDEVAWVLNWNAENCPDCQDYADMGWQRVDDDPYNGAYPGSGHTVCLTNCRCHLEWRSSQTGESWED